MNDANHDKIDLRHFYFIKIFFIIFFTYIEVSKDSSAKYYQNNK